MVSTTTFRLVLAATVAALAAATPQQAESLPYTLGDFTFFGSGCPAGSVKVTPSSNGKSVTVRFSAFAAKTTSVMMRDRKACNIAVPIDLKPGYTVALSQMDYHGKVYVPNNAGSVANFSAEYFFTGDQGPQFTQSYTSGFRGDIFESDPVALVKYAPCGASTVFRVNANVVAQKIAANHRDVQITIDSAQSTLGGFHYNVDVKPC